MQPYFQVAVKIATVVAACPKGGSIAGSLASAATWAGLAWVLAARVPQLLYPAWASGLRSAGGRGLCPPVRRWRGRRADSGWLGDRSLAPWPWAL